MILQRPGAQQGPGVMVLPEHHQRRVSVGVRKIQPTEKNRSPGAVRPLLLSCTRLSQTTLYDFLRKRNETQHVPCRFSYRFIYLSIYSFIYRSIYTYIYIYMSFHPSIHLSIYLSINLLFTDIIYKWLQEGTSIRGHSCNGAPKRKEDGMSSGRDKQEP